MTMHCRWKLKIFYLFILRLHYYLYFFYSFYISFSFLHVSHLTASPSLLSSSIDPSLIYTSPTATDPSPLTWPISTSLLYFQHFGFVFRAVLVFWVCVSGCAYVSSLCFGHGFQFGYVDFSAFFFCSSSLVLMGMTGLWLCSDFHGFDGGCGCVLVVEWNIILL